MSSYTRKKEGARESRKRNRQENMLRALEAHMGIVSRAAEEVGLSRECHYNWLAQDEEYKNKVLEIQNVVLDFAESALHNQIKDGNHVSTIFYLKTKGKERGYIETGQPNNEKPMPVEINFNVADPKGKVVITKPE